MEGSQFRDARLRIARWIEEGETVLAMLPGLFEDHERVAAALEAAEQETARLRREADDLRQEVSALHSENELLRRERDEVAEAIAEGINKLMNDALQRLRAPLRSRSPLAHEPTYS